MRCQKCGFISFDQQSSCNKCGVDQTATPLAYTGTGQKTDPPFFLAAALGEAVEHDAPMIDIEETVNEEVHDGATALFDELEAESQGMIHSEPPPEIELSFAEPEEEISLVIPEEEAPEISLEEEEESLEISLEIPEPEEEIAVEEIAAEPTPEPEEALEITLEIPEEETLELAVEEAEEEIVMTEEEAPEKDSLELSLEMPVDDDAAPAEEETAEEDSLDLSLEMPTDNDEYPAEENLEVKTEPMQTASSLDLEEIDLSDLISDSGATAEPVNDNEEIFDLSSLIGDADEDTNGDELALTMDVSDEIDLATSDDEEGRSPEPEK